MSAQIAEDDILSPSHLEESESPRLVRYLIQNAASETPVQVDS